MSDHTPGPWALVFSSYGDEIWFGGEGHGMWTIDPVGAYLAGSLKDSFYDPTPDKARIAEANARLIAAAPDLLAACEALSNFQRRYDEATLGNKMPGNDLYSGLLMAIVDQANAAIAKTKRDLP